MNSDVKNGWKQADAAMAQVEKIMGKTFADAAVTAVAEDLGLDSRYFELTGGQPGK